jgi:photosystem II stability/assembly factor-like uncharacterized protein
MTLSARGMLVPLLLALPLCAQEQPPAAAPPPPIVSSAPVLQNNGKPMMLPFQCTDDDVQWAGLTCSEEDPCPIYLELSAVAAQSKNIVAVGNLHTASVTLYTALLATNDGGQTWKDSHQRVRGAGLDHIQFLDSDTAWVTGLTLFPLAQDPFLLLTTDGGETWRTRPIASESHPGSIQQFYFTSRTEGTLVIDRGPAEQGDRYERYQSSDGGESWTIQEESTKPLRLRVAAGPSADWRLRADSASKSYVLERRQSERWTAVASFAVNVGACKPKVR